MEAKFFDSLYEGDSANGVKLCMGVTGGDFWPRPAGVQLLYRGPSEHNIDFSHIVAAADFDACTIAVPTSYQHCPGSYYVYVLRRANCCGEEEKTISAAIRACFDGDGNLVNPRPNRVFAVRAGQSDADKVVLVWFYWPTGNNGKISHFAVYGDNGSGTIDYENPLAIVDYVGRKFYRYEASALTADTYMFCIRAVSADDMDDNFCGEITVQLNRQAPSSVEISGTTVI